MPILRIRELTPLIYGLSMLPLLAVFVIGTGKYGRQWINLGLFYLQPAELLKVCLPMMVAWYLNRVPLPPRVPVVLVAAAIIGLPVGLVMLQPDFGTAVLIAASGVFVLLLAGLPWWWVGVGVGGVAAAAPVAWFWFLRPYQKDRIMMFWTRKVTRWGLAGTSSSPRSRSARAAGPARAGDRAARPT